ncbi:MAG TPA: sulfotransferase [Acidimicrobiales bacterium]|nr:sulfotransferase [Acidimicrobiales bacterium]
MVDDRLLDEEAVRDDAATAAGVKGWDDADIAEPLQVLLDTVKVEGRLSEVGAEACGTRVRNLLRGFIQMQADATDHPDILDEEVGPPLVLIGLPRSGTTLFHALLSRDPEARAPLWWESLYPSPPPEAKTFFTDPRIAKVDAEFESMKQRNPNYDALQPWAAELTAECNTLAQPCLRSIAFSAYYDIPGYTEWYLSADQAALYRYHRRALKQLQWRGPKGRWVVKSPTHFFTLPALVGEYPDAVILQTHRDPAQTIGSQADMYLANRVLYSDDTDARAVGRDSFELWARGTDLMLAFRRDHPEVRVVDVAYPELVADPIGTVRSAYAQIGREVSPAMEHSMNTWMEENARDKRPKHAYRLEDFGLTAGEVRARFGDYLDEFGAFCGLSGPES